MIQRVFLVMATLMVGALFVSGPLRMATPQGVTLEEFWGLSPNASLLVVFGGFGLLPAVTALAQMVMAARQRRLGDSDAAETSESSARVSVAVLVLAQVLVIPYHEHRLTSVHQVGTIVKVGTRRDEGYKGTAKDYTFVDVDTVLPGGKTVRASPRITDDDAKRVKVGDRIDTFSNSDESHLGVGATLRHGLPTFAAVFIGSWLVSMLQEAFEALRKAGQARGRPTTAE